MKDFISYRLPLILWASIIFFLSSLTALPHIETPIISSDKLAHMAVYFILCALSWRAFYYQSQYKLLKRYALLWAFIFTSLYGYSDEFHQIFVPNRSFDFYDLLADAIGGLLFIMLFLITESKKRRKHLV